MQLKLMEYAAFLLLQPSQDYLLLTPLFSDLIHAKIMKTQCQN